MMDIKDCQLFITLAATLHFGRTGEQMHMSPSAVSRHVQRLETALGQALLERDNRRVSLTDAGRQFHRYAQQAVAHWQQFQQGLLREGESLTGEVSVYCSVTAVYGVLAGVLEPFRQRHPGIEIKLHTGDHAAAVQRVLAGEEDIAITARPDKLPPRLQFQTLTHSPLRFIYPAMPGPVEQQVSPYSQQPSALAWDQLPFIFSERGVARNRLDQWFRQQGLKPNIYAQVSGNEAIVSMVALGFGMAVVPELVLANSPLRDKVQVLDVQPPLAPFAVGICALRQRLSNPQVKAFWDCAKASYQADF
jgi:LysR family positive regulator for ilvC